MEFNGREYREVVLSSGDKLLTLSKFKGGDWLKIVKQFTEEGDYTSEKIMANSDKIFVIFCKVLGEDGVEKKTDDYLNNIDIEDMGVVLAEIAKATEAIFLKMTPKKVK